MKSIYENLGGTYKANGDYSLPTFVLPKEEPFEIGVWGQRYLRHLKENHRIIYYNYLTKGILNKHITEVDIRAEKIFQQLVKSLAEKENVTESLKAKDKPKEEYQIIFNTQEAIIDEQIWLRVQELRKNKRRNTATGRQSLFAGLLFCADCGSKLHFCAAKSLKRNQEFYRCANYKDGRGSCTIHYIRDVVLQQIVLDEISALADFVRCYGSVFRIIQQNKQSSLHKKRVHELTQTLENSKKRIADLDKLFTRIYEDNVIGKLPDDRYSKMAVAYEKEQKELELLISDCEKELRDAEKKTVDMKTLYQGLMEFTEIKELTPTIVNKLIKRIEIHNPEKKHAHNSVKVDITFTAIGLFQNPDEAELKKLMQAVKENSSEYKQISA
jgi:site-specific recombinases, DNA invertase pin homologs